MKKKLLGAVLSVAMVATLLAGCGGAAPAADAPAAPAATEEAPAAEAEAPAAEEAAPADDAAAAPADGMKVGVAMPTKDLQRWNQDGSNMEKELKDAGYEVDLQYASNDVQTQVSQIENMINNGCGVLVIASIEGDSLGTVLASAKEKNIPVIAYDRLIMNTDAVSYYATFDNYMVGTKQGEYIRDQLDLDKADGLSILRLPQVIPVITTQDTSIRVLSTFFSLTSTRVSSLLSQARSTSIQLLQQAGHQRTHRAGLRTSFLQPMLTDQTSTHGFAQTTLQHRV